MWQSNVQSATWWQEDSRKIGSSCRSWQEKRKAVAARSIFYWSWYTRKSLDRKPTVQELANFFSSDGDEAPRDAAWDGELGDEI